MASSPTPIESDEFSLTVGELLALQNFATEKLQTSLAGFFTSAFAILVRRYQGLGSCIHLFDLKSLQIRLRWVD